MLILCQSQFTIKIIANQEKMKREKELAGQLKPVGPAQEELCRIVHGQFSSVTILQGQHGSGKTIQVPAVVSQQVVGNVPCKSLVVQPNLLNARAVVNRMNQHLFAGGKLKGNVELARTASPIGNTQSLITYTTDEVMSSFLNTKDGVKAIDGYRVVFIDDIHYKSTATELLLLRIKGIMLHRDARGNPVHFVLMSATLEFEELEKYFNKPRIDTLRLEPVHEDPAKPLLTECYAEKSTYGALPEVYLKIGEIVTTKANIRETVGILVFLRNDADVEIAFDECQSRFQGTSCKILNDIPIENPDNAVTCAGPKIVLTTDSRALGLTIEHIDAVIVTGTSDIRTFDSSLGHSTISEVLLSNAQVQQQAWRVGRKSPGQCHYMFTQETAKRLDAYKKSDIPTSDDYQYILGLFSIFPGQAPYKGSMELIVYPQPPVARFMIRRLRLMDCIARPEKNSTGGYSVVDGAALSNSIPNLSQNARLLISQIRSTDTPSSTGLMILMACIISEPRRPLVRPTSGEGIALDQMELVVYHKITETGDVWMQLCWLVLCKNNGFSKVVNAHPTYHFDTEVFTIHNAKYASLSEIYKWASVPAQLTEGEGIFVLYKMLIFLGEQLLDINGGSPATHLASGQPIYLGETVLQYRNRRIYAIYLDLTMPEGTRSWRASYLLHINDSIVRLTGRELALGAVTHQQLGPEDEEAYKKLISENMRCLRCRDVAAEIRKG